MDTHDDDTPREPPKCGVQLQANNKKMFSNILILMFEWKLAKAKHFVLESPCKAFRMREAT